MHLQLATVGQEEENQTNPSSMGQDNLLDPVLGLDFQRRPVEEQITPAWEWPPISSLRLALAAGRVPFGEQRILQGHLEIDVPGSTLLFYSLVFSLLSWEALTGVQIRINKCGCLWRNTHPEGLDLLHPYFFQEVLKAE